MSPDLRLNIDGQLYGGWQSIRVQRSIERVTGTFSLSVTERWSGQDTPRPIHPGDACEVLIDGEAIITGYVDDVDVSYDGTNHTVTVAGRDKTADIVDCSAPVTGSSLVGQTLLTAAQRLCAPFGVKVRAEVDVGGRFTVLRTNPGDSVFAALDAGARVRAVIMVADGQGNLVITRASSERLPTALQLGANVLSCSGSFSHKDRFSEYRVLGQQEAQDQELFGETAFHLTGTAKDALVLRHRPLVVTAIDLNGNATAQQRAEWERNVRYGRSQRLQYTVQGWHYAPGQLWPINRLVPVRDRFLGLDVDRLITEASYTLDDGGLRTELVLMPREAFDMIPTPEVGDQWAQI